MQPHRRSPAARPGGLGRRRPSGVLSSAVPFVADLMALRRVPPHFFGVFMSVNPVFAALIGLAVLDQHLDAASWSAVAVIVTANTVVVSAAPRPGVRADAAHEPARSYCESDPACPARELSTDAREHLAGPEGRLP
ncbi:EamA family transporter [Streptomyces sp. NBC_00059]|nr:EamA family transporter [Streptomyces sp. NBC_00059]